MNKTSDFTVFIDKGHAKDTAGKRTPFFADGSFTHESEFNLPVSQIIFRRLVAHGFNCYHVSPQEEIDKSLTDRTTTTNDIYIDDNLTSSNSCFVSIHYNAYDGVFNSKSGGVETYHYPDSTKGSRLATAIHNEVIQGTEQYNRGIKDANFHVLRETKMPAALIEFGFMDKYDEAILMLDDDFQSECAEDTVRGICKYFDVEYVPVVEVTETSSVVEQLQEISLSIDNLLETLMYK